MSVKKYEHVFFDLDHTLWDFDKNSAEALVELYEGFELYRFNIPSAEVFIERFHFYNYEYWKQFNAGIINQEELRLLRFESTFAHFGQKKINQIHEEFHLAYLAKTPYKPHLLEGAVDLLEYLSSKYTLHILSNGFKEIQHIKVNASKIAHFFKNLITAESTGYRKPNPKMFELALQLCNTYAHASIMIGDDLEADILGAKSVGIDQIWLSSKYLENQAYPTFQVSHLLEIKHIL